MSFPLFEVGCKLDGHRNETAIVRAEAKSIAVPYGSGNSGHMNVG